jgi:Tfp pilus assembly protein PilF
MSSLIWHPMQGCVSQPRSEVASPIGEIDNSSLRASALAEAAGARMSTDAKDAHRLLQQALEIDPYCGSAHNNIGILYLRGLLPDRGVDLFTAAESFQLAAKLLPGRPDPRMNLGLVMERAGRLDDALHSFRSAVEASPSHMPSVEALTSLEIRLGRGETDTRARLELIALGGTTETWRQWARDRLLRADR